MCKWGLSRPTSVDSDVCCRFKWDVSKLAADFSLSPVEGYVSAGMDVPFDVVYHPRDVSNDLRSEVSDV